MSKVSTGKFIIPAWIKILSLVEKHSTSEIPNVANVTSAHVYNMLKTFKEYGLIHSEKIGRHSVITLTDKGKEIQSLSLSLYEKIDSLKRSRLQTQKVLGGK